MSPTPPRSATPLPLSVGLDPPVSIYRGRGPCPLPIDHSGRPDPALTQQHPQSGGPGAQGVLLHLDAVQHLRAVRLPAGEAPLQRLGTCCYIHGTRGALRAPPARVLARPLAGRLASRRSRRRRGAGEPGRRGPRGVGAAAGAAGCPRRVRSGHSLAPGPGVVREGRGGCSPRRALSRGTRGYARRLLCLSPACQPRSRAAGAAAAAADGAARGGGDGGGGAGGAGGGGGGGRGRGWGCRGGPAG